MKYCRDVDVMPSFLELLSVVFTWHATRRTNIVAVHCRGGKALGQWRIVDMWKTVTNIFMPA